jgi:hypothetical protein
MTTRMDDVVYWSAIIVAPTIYLADLSLAYALVPWVCASGHVAVLHAVSAIGLAIVLAPLALGWRVLRKRANDTASPRSSMSRFLADLAIASPLLFALATLLQWFAQFAIGPCVT